MGSLLNFKGVRLANYIEVDVLVLGCANILGKCVFFFCDGLFDTLGKTLLISCTQTAPLS